MAHPEAGPEEEEGYGYGGEERGALEPPHGPGVPATRPAAAAAGDQESPAPTSAPPRETRKIKRGRAGGRAGNILMGRLLCLE